MSITLYRCKRFPLKKYLTPSIIGPGTYTHSILNKQSKIQSLNFKKTKRWTDYCDDIPGPGYYQVSNRLMKQSSSHSFDDKNLAFNKSIPNSNNNHQKLTRESNSSLNLFNNEDILNIFESVSKIKVSQQKKQSNNQYKTVASIFLS